jgi:MerR family transcriptional regulator, light-induced transcriptional regulator
MANYTIKDLERLSGIKAHTIRIWEKRYGLIEPERTLTNIRTYCDAELRKLLNISVLNRNGYKISRIVKLSHEEITDNINKLTENPTDTESQIENLAIAMIDLDESKFEKILSRAIMQLGFEDTVIRVLNPFLVRIGIMWQTGSINPAQEHFVSNLIRQKILVAIDSQISGENRDSKTFLLFLPEGERHELGLLFANYMIRKRGHKVIYLGQNVPLSNLEEIIKIRHIDYLLTAFVTNASNLDLTKYLANLENISKNKPIFLSGEQIISYKGKLLKNQKILDSPHSLISELNYISSL